MAARRRTSTSSFGVGGRENHDASAFYERFRAPDLSDDTYIPKPNPIIQPFIHGDARSMDQIEDGSVALVVTSPPYFAGKQYEEELERDGVPSSYLEYLEMLTEVFHECARKLEPGGRIAVNVANLGRKPYRSLSADVIRILEHELGVLLRGELVWQKGQGASGSCAWGSFRSPANPVLRDITERVIVASKGRFDRALSIKDRAAQELPHHGTLMTDDFMALTLDVWSIPAESAKRVGHPAPFPVELPAQLIRLYTFEHDLVLDPFMGSGSALVAAAKLGRRYVGFDLDADYVRIAEKRVAKTLSSTAQQVEKDGDNFLRRTTEDGKAAPKLAEEVLVDAGFHIIDRDRRVSKSGVTVNFVAEDADGTRWFFDVAGAFASHRGGLLRMDAVWKSLGRAAALKGRIGAAAPLVFLTTNLPRRPSDGDTALRAAGPDLVFDAIEMLATDGRDRLQHYASGGRADSPLAGFWLPADLK